MSEIVFNPNTHYLCNGTYTTADGRVKQYLKLIKKNPTGRSKGRPEKLPDTDIEKLKELRALELSWKKIGNNLGISAYHAKKIYSEISSDTDSSE